LEFVTKKITDGVAKIKFGLADELRLGNLDSKRDWGFAGDYVRAMWLMLQQDKPGDYVISSDQNHSVGEFARLAFEHIDMDYKEYVKIDPRFVRPAEVDVLLGDSSLARKKLKWETTVSFDQLVKMMVDYDLEKYRKISGE
ncbi:MAG: GDP-mannose 4,6-dehydratase, partial [candidate division Zixibacteria bacterium]|nr:GDP-mannose 4,6-dehydratase [candidate division Zixibacteria bacterium]